MGFRIRKSVKILPGIRVNLSNRGVSGSAGVPGTGVSWHTRKVVLGGKAKGRATAMPAAAPAPARSSFLGRLAIGMLLGLAALLWALLR